MTQNGTIASIAVFDYSHNKKCDLYDSQVDLEGQAYDIEYIKNTNDGIKKLTFSIPFKVDEAKNFRWKFLKSEYLIRLIYKDEVEWFIAQKPKKQKEKNGIIGTLTCSGLEVSLKTKNIYKEFDDENGIGTLGELVDKILAGTGWTRGHTDPMLEKDGVTEKIRSLNSKSKQGSLGLMSTVCNLFRCFPVYKSDTKVVELYNFNNREMVLEGTVGTNLESLSVEYDSSDIITRLYVEGEYGEHEYIGIDSVNPTGLSYILNFDYYRELGMFTQEHEDALAQYLEDIGDLKEQVSAATVELIENEDAVNNLIGQCKLVVYDKSDHFTVPKHVYGDPTAAQQELNVGDEVVVVNTDGTFRYDTIETTPMDLAGANDYWIAKFVTKAAGTIGAYEVQVEAKDKEVENLQRKISVTVKADKIAEYNAEISRLQTEKETIYTKTDGLYDQMYELVKSDGLLYQIDYYNGIIAGLQDDMDDVESDFIIAMGDMIRDGYWNDQNYVSGQEQALYDDSVERMDILCKPSVTYSFNTVRLSQQFGIPLEDFVLNALFRVHDDELEVNENLFIIEITIGVDDESKGNVRVSNQDLTINANNLSELLSRMSQLSDLIEQKNALYDRAQAISRDGTMYSDRLNGQINVLQNQIISTVSNWYTDDQGNLMFEAADGSGAMMLSGAGFMLANSKDANDNWIWRTFGTGAGFTADEIVAGFISANRIESGAISTEKLDANAVTAAKIASGAITTDKLDAGAVTTAKLAAGAVTANEIASGTITTSNVAANFGETLVISANSAIIAIDNQISSPFVENQAYTTGAHVHHNGKFYVFTDDFAGGTFTQALNYLSETSVASELELVPGKISAYVNDNAYLIQSGVEITNQGVTISGGKFLKLISGGVLDVQATNFYINSTDKTIGAGDWKFYDNGLNMTKSVTLHPYIEDSWGDRTYLDDKTMAVAFNVGRSSAESGSIYDFYMAHDYEVRGGVRVTGGTLYQNEIYPNFKIGTNDNRPDVASKDKFSGELVIKPGMTEFPPSGTTSNFIGAPIIIPSKDKWWSLGIPLTTPGQTTMRRFGHGAFMNLYADNMLHANNLFYEPGDAVSMNTDVVDYNDLHSVTSSYDIWRFGSLVILTLRLYMLGNITSLTRVATCPYKPPNDIIVIGTTISSSNLRQAPFQLRTNGQIRANGTVASTNESTMYYVTFVFFATNI